MARWWCVASTDPVSLQRIVAALLLGLLTLSAFDPLLTERSAQGQLGWLAGMLVAALALVQDRRRSARDRAAGGGAASLTSSSGSPPSGHAVNAGGAGQAGQAGQAGHAGHAVQAVVGIDSSATLYRGPVDAGALEPVDTTGLGSWRVGPWQFVHFRGRRAGPRFLAFDRRRADPLAWAALQRALVRARRRNARGSAGSLVAPASRSFAGAAADVPSTAASPVTDVKRRPPRQADDR